MMKKMDRFPTGDWNIPTREEEAKMHYWIMGVAFFLMLVFIPYALASIDFSTWKPGDVSSFTVTEDDNTYYLEIDEAVYTSEFNVLIAQANVSSYAFSDLTLNGHYVNFTDQLATELKAEHCSNDCYWAIINADTYSTVTSNSNVVEQIGNKTFFIYNDNADYEVARAKFWSTALYDYPSRWANNGTYSENITQVIISDPDDVGYMGYYIFIEGRQNSDAHYYQGWLNGTFTTTSGGGTGIWTNQWCSGVSGGDCRTDFWWPEDWPYWNQGTGVPGVYSTLNTDTTGNGVSGEPQPTNPTGFFMEGSGTDYQSSAFGQSIAIFIAKSDFTNVTTIEPSDVGYGVWTQEIIKYTQDRGVPATVGSGMITLYDYAIDFEPELTLAMNECSGDPCLITFNVTGTSWGNFTLSNLIVNITTAPTTPSTLAPIDGAIYFNPPQLTCDGSIDPDGDTINYLFRGAYSNYCNCSDTIAEWSGTGSWEENCLNGNSFGDMCRFATPTTGTYARERDYFIDTNTLYFDYKSPGAGGYGSSYIHVSVDGTNILEITNNDCQAGCSDVELDVSAWNDGLSHTIEVEMARPGGGDPGMWLEWWWNDLDVTQAEGEAGELLQNSTSTTFTWSNITLGTQSEWWCEACDNTGTCSNSTAIRIINQMLFQVCDIGSSSVALNITSWDEEDDTPLNTTIESSITLSSDYDSILFSNSDPNKHEHNYCLTPENFDISGTGFFQYLPDNSSYTFPRQYYIESLIMNGNNTEDIKTYSLTDALSTAVTFIASRAGSAVPNILIHLQRFDPSTGLFSLIATGKTSGAGTDVIYLRLTDAFYRVIAYESPYSTDELVYDSGTTHITSSPYTMLLSGGSTGQTNNWYDTWNAFGSIAYSLTFNETGTNAFLLVADDSSGATTSMCLKVDKVSAQGGQQNVCYDCATTSSVSISCIIPDTNSYYTAKFIANQNSDLFQAVYGFAIDLTTGIGELIGNANGAFFTFLLVGVSAFMALYSPMASVVLAVLAFGIGWAMGLVDTDMSMFMVLVAFSAIVIATMYKRRTY